MMMRMGFWVALAVPTATFAQDCPEDVSTARLSETLETAELAYADLDVPAFGAATDTAAALLACIDEKLPRNVAAQYHRIRGLKSFIERDPAGSTQSFASARSIEPGYQFPESLVPAGNPVLADYTAIDPATGKVRTMPKPKGGYLVIDGRTTQERPVSFPTIFQIVDGSGVVVQTTYLAGGDRAPTYEEAPPEQVQTGPPPTDPGVTPRSASGPNVALLAGAGGAAVVSGALYAYASVKANTYWNDDTMKPSQYKDLQGSVNTMVIASGAAAAVAVGLGAGSFLVSADGTLTPALHVRF